MTDTISQRRRSWNMSRIRGCNTAPEIRVRSLLHGMGYRFRVHRRDLPGRPDVVLPKYRTAIFVHGCFWHRHAKCRMAYTPKSRSAFWTAKFRENTARDHLQTRALRRLGWNVVVIWECQTKSEAVLKRLISKGLSKGTV